MYQSLKLRTRQVSPVESSKHRVQLTFYHLSPDHLKMRFKCQAVSQSPAADLHLQQCPVLLRCQVSFKQGKQDRESALLTSQIGVPSDSISLDNISSALLYYSSSRTFPLLQYVCRSVSANPFGECSKGSGREIRRCSGPLFAMC